MGFISGIFHKILSHISHGLSQPPLSLFLPSLKLLDNPQLCSQLLYLSICCPFSSGSRLLPVLSGGSHTQIPYHFLHSSLLLLMSNTMPAALQPCPISFPYSFHFRVCETFCWHFFIISFCSFQEERGRF